MGHKVSIMVAFSITIVAGLFATFTVAFADEQSTKELNPFNMVYNFLQDLKYDLSDDTSKTSVSDTLSVAVIVQLKNEVEDLTLRLDSLEDPTKIYTTELLPVTNIDCSDRNNARALISGWCPHPTRNIYFIEDSRIQKDSIISISLDDAYNDEMKENMLCGVINQDTFSFSFHDPQTGEVTTLEDLHGFIMKCDQRTVSPDTILRYTIINS